MTTAPPWTPAEIELLRTLTAECFTASQIAARVGNGKTRNSVVGKWFRLGLSKSRPKPERTGKIKLTPASEKAPRVHRPSVKRPEPSLPALPVPAVIEPEPIVGVNVVQLESRMCKFPIGDPQQPDFRYCGKPQRENSPYCAHHAAICYQPASDRRMKRAAT